MALRSPQNDYNPIPDATATVDGSGARPLDVRASPEAFGSQVDQAIGSAGEKAFAVAQHQQGMLNETASNNAETEFVQKAGDLKAKYFSLEGSAAVAATPQYQQDVIALRQSVRQGMNPMAAKMFDDVTHRYQAYAISDSDTYKAQQTKKAAVDSNNAIGQNAVNAAGDAHVAADDNRFNEQLGDIRHSVNSMMELQGYGVHASDDGKGGLRFDDTPEGKNASQVYQQELDRRTGAAWENRIRSLADQNVKIASEVFQKNRDSIPGDAQVRLDAMLAPKVRDYEARDGADSLLLKHDQQYQQQITGSKTGDNLKPSAVGDPQVHALIDTKADEIGVPRNIAHALAMQESGENMHPQGSNDGGKAAGVFQLHEGAAKDTGVDRTTLEGNVTGGLKYLKQQYDKYGDWNKALAAYNVGSGTLDAAGGDVSKIPQAQKYSSEVMARAGSSGAPVIRTTSSVPSKADYYRTNYDSISEEARQQAQQLHPDDPVFADNMVAKVQQRMSNAIRGQELSYKADNDTVVKAVNGGFTKGTPPTSVAELRATSPEAAAAWDRLTVNNPVAASAIEARMLTANARGGDKLPGPARSATEARLFLPSSNPDAITDESQLWPLVAKGQISPKDRDDLSKMLGEMQEPKNRMMITQKQEALTSVLDQIVPRSLRNAKGYEPTVEESTRMQNARLAVEQADEDAIKAGKTAQQRYSPDSKDYIGNAAKPFLPSPFDKIASARAGIPPAPAVGTVSKGFRFLGGNPADQKNWAKE